MSQDSITLNGTVAECTINFIDSLIEKLKEFIDSRDGPISVEEFREFLNIPPVVKSNRLKMPSNKSKSTRTSVISDDDKCKHIALRAPYNRCAKKKSADCGDYCKVHFEQRARNEQKSKDPKNGGKTSFDQKEESLIPLPGERGSNYQPSNGHVFGKKAGEVIVKGKLENLSEVKDDDFKAKIVHLSREECDRYKEYKVPLATSALPPKEDVDEDKEENEQEAEIKEQSKAVSEDVEEDGDEGSQEVNEEKTPSPKKPPTTGRGQIVIPKPPRKQ